MSGTGYFLITTDSYPPNSLAYQLETGLSYVLVPYVHLYFRVLDHTRVECLALSMGSSSGDTWCILPTGQFAYFSSDSGVSQTGAQGLVLTHISDVVPPSAFVLPAVPSSAPT